MVPGARFCTGCGMRLDADSRSSAPAEAPARAPVAERRLVSVLFADLVGFTTLSEHRDPEAVRELLSEYFERCRMLIERYGGTVEKFIGDAVMAVWGSPIAREDDAERAVRAALSLTGAVSALGEEVGMPELRVRAGVLTGNAAVELGAEGEGMVLGDTVNTASRLQSIAQPGTVLVDDVTRRASEAAIAYEDAGTHQVKGRERPVRAWTALRVVAGTGGFGRVVGVEAPFRGRDAALQALTAAAERSAREGRAELIAVVGEAGSGKSRLLWEYFKHLDGIQEVRWWQEGRCLSYGEGVAYWALAEMIRTRARIAEEDPPGVAREKLRAAVEEHVPDERERRLVEPRLAHLLRLEERPEADRADLFSGWRLFLERMAGQHPLILAFEDLQWADSGLLEFIDYLLEWSAEFPIFIIALGRTELRERRPAWDPIALEPLAAEHLRAILDGLVPGLPDHVVAEIVIRADGIPLYAVETVRMLQDRGLLVQEGAQYRLTREVDDLEIPETLQALVASRLDGLDPQERTLLQTASVLGQTFAPAALAALSDRREEEVRTLLDGLVSKQIISRDDDPISPERGQYSFLQALVRTVAYGTLGRRTRKTLHLAAARYMRESWPGEVSEIAEVLAAHYLEAIRTDPEAADVGELRAHARETLTAAGRAAASLTLGVEADRYFAHAAELAEDDAERAALVEQAGIALMHSGELTQAEERLRRALELARAAGDATGGSAAVELATVLGLLGGNVEASELLAPYRHPEAVERSVLSARAFMRLALDLMASGSPEGAGELMEHALTILEDQQEWTELATAFVARGVYLTYLRRVQEALAALRHALLLAEEHDAPAVAIRAHYNLAGVYVWQQRFEPALQEVEAGLALARDRGDHSWENALRSQSMYPLLVVGRWDDMLRGGVSLLDSDDKLSVVMAAMALALVAGGRGDDALGERVRQQAEEHREHTTLDIRGGALVALASLAHQQGDAAAAIKLAQEGEETAHADEAVTEAIRIRIECLLSAGDLADMDAMVSASEAKSPARRTPIVRSGCARLRAEAAHIRGEEDEALGAEHEAEELLRSIGARTLLALALLDRVRRRDDPAARQEAHAILTELGAVRWLAQLDEAAGQVGVSRAPAG